MIEIQESSFLSDILNELYSALNKVVEDNKYDFSSNIFHILGIEHREVPISSYLAYLLDPRASHGQGYQFLKEFLKQDSAIQEIKELPWNRTQVYTEFVISRNRRIDILLVHPDFVRIIEVKIYAKDQDSQLTDYVNDLRKIYTNVKAIYLTLDGAEPSDISRDELKKGDDYICMSFRHDVMRMLNSYELGEVSEDGGLNQFDYNFKQFKEDVKFMVGINSEEEDLAIEKFIFKKSENYEIARRIYNYFNNTTKQSNFSFNDFIANQLEKALREKWEQVFNDQNYVDVGQQKNIVYKISDSESKNNLYFCIAKSEGEYPFCIGFVKINEEGKVRLDTNNQKLPGILDKNEYKNSTGFWHCWKYLPDGGLTGPIFNDNKLNSLAIDLLKSPRKNIIDYINKSLNTIKDYVNNAFGWKLLDDVQLLEEIDFEGSPFESNN